MSNRRIFTEEFKAGAVQLVISSGRSVKEVATELGIKEGTLGAWVRTWRAEHPDAGVDEPGRLTELRAEVAQEFEKATRWLVGIS